MNSEKGDVFIKKRGIFVVLVVDKTEDDLIHLNDIVSGMTHKIPHNDRIFETLKLVDTNVMKHDLVETLFEEERVFQRKL